VVAEQAGFVVGAANGSRPDLPDAGCAAAGLLRSSF